MKNKGLMKVVVLEILIISFFTVNGAYVSLTSPSNAFMQYVGLVPLMIGILFYLLIKRKWGDYFSLSKLKPCKETLVLCSPLVLVLAILFFSNGGIESGSITTLITVIVTQIMIVAFIEEMVFRGFMMNVLISNGYKVAVIVSSLLFALTHSLQLLSGKSLEDTILQITYAFFIGMVLSLLIVNKQSIIIAIAFHGLNNFFIIMSTNNGASIFNYFLILILIIHSGYLWNVASKTSKVITEHITKVAV